MKNGWRYSGCWLFVLMAWAGGLCAQQSAVDQVPPDSVKAGDAARDGGLVRGYGQICEWSKSGRVECRV